MCHRFFCFHCSEVRMKRHLIWNVSGIVILIANLLPTSALAAPSAENHPAPAAAPSDLGAALPGWFTGNPTNSTRSAGTGSVLPGWFTDLSEPLASPPASPDFQPLQVAIPDSVLSVNVFGPSVASLGSPVGAGEVYTAVIRNSSVVSTAYNIFLMATHQSYFIHDGGDQLIASIATTTASIPFSLTTDLATITWTPQITVDLIPGQVLTLNFKLRAACDAQSGQQMRVGIYYNADPAQPPTEFNSSGLNITTGRGNLVITKKPGIQNLNSSDYGRPITWTVTVQNTGLGILYGAMVTDTGGISLSQPGGDLVPSVFIPSMQINESRAFTVVGTVEACNFTNIARASWTCGNLAGDATAANPISTTTSVLFSPDIPRINLQVSSPITFSYCSPLTRTVVVTIANTGGPAGSFRLDSDLESNGFLQIITPSMNSNWQYEPASGLFAYAGGSPTGTIPGPTATPVTLTFQVRPASNVCSAGSGDVLFDPLFNDVCNGAPFTANPVTLRYDFAQGEAPTLGLAKSGPGLIHSGDVFYYQVTVTGTNGINISGTVSVVDVLPPQFVLTGLISASAGISSTSGQTLSWSFNPPPSYGPFTETLTFQVQDVLTKAQCGASSIVRNNAQARATPTCSGCSTLAASGWVDTAIANNESIYSFRGSSASAEACSLGGLTFYNQYVITGATVITWTGAVFTDAMGVGVISPPLAYRPGSLSVTVGITDYAAILTPTVVNGRLVIDLSPLQAAGALTQNVTLQITYTVDFSDAMLAPGNRVQFWAWSQLYLPNVSTVNACAADNSYNDATYVTLTRGDLNVWLEPAILNRCHTNTVTIHVDHPAGADPSDITDHIVVTFTASADEVRSARNFRYGGALLSVGAINIVTDTTIGGGRGVITFTLPVTADVDSDGTILFDVDVDCNLVSTWNVGLTFQSCCAVPYARTATRDHTYLKPDLILFATPIEYTVRQKEVVWKFYVANNGNLAADSVVVTNTLNGITATSYARSSGTAGVALVGTPPNAAVFNITNLPPNDAVEVTVTGTVFLCDPLSVDIAAQLDCLGATCQQPRRHITFNTPPPYLLTNNGQTADLPMCDTGAVVFRTKNASPDVTLYQLDITETLRGLEPAAGEPFTVTIVDLNGALITSTTAFTPQVTHPNVTDTLLIWQAVSAPSGIFDSLNPLAVVVITVPVRTSCVPPNSPQSFASASVQGPCGKQLGYTENAVTLQTAKPHMTIEKLGQGPTGGYGKYVAANPGDQIVWQLRVENQNIDHPYVAYNVILSDTWPSNFQFVTATLDFSPTFVLTDNTVLWNLGTVMPGIPLYFYITGTLTGAACQARTQNASRLSFGCADGCDSSIVPVDYAYVDSSPDLLVSLAPEPLQTCAGDIPVTIRNYGATAHTTTLTVTLPSGYVYSETVGSGLAPTEIISTPGSSPQFRWDTIPGRPDPVAGSYSEFTLTLRVRSSASSGACPVSDDPLVRTDLEYNNDAACIPDNGPFTRTASTSLTVLSPTLEIAKTPGTQTGAVGQRITWTIALTNVGTGIAPDLVVTDQVGSNFDPASILASNGSDGATPTRVNNVVTWTVASVPVSGTWSATVSAVLVSTGDNRNVVTASSTCATGCQAATATDTAYTTLVQDFAKNPAIQTGTIGSLAVFTFAVSLPDQDAVYTGLALTDTLPAGLGYVSSTVEYSYNTGASGDLISDTPTITPGWLASGPVVWKMGDLPGAVQINGVITTVIQNIPSNYDGLRLTNILTMSYTDRGQPYVYTDTAQVDVQEPVLHIGKSYVTPYGCGATLLQDNFNRAAGLIPPWLNPGGGSGWALNNGTASNNSNGANRRIYSAIGASWTDYSFSAMIRSTDTSGDMGLLFRVQSDGNYYRFRWTNNAGVGNYRLERNTTLIGAAAGSAYAPNRWYHIEIRVMGNRLQVFIDGALALERTDPNPAPYSSGYVGLYANNQNAAFFDDILVTRLDNLACIVGANDLVTYTLTVSNQNQLPGYDLVITDVVPADMSLVAYTMQSDDPASAITAQPAPIPGATGSLVWGVNQLTSTVPYNPLVHNALTLTVVLRVSPGITANVVLSNQASLAYDNWLGSTSPTTVTRQYSGGSHSTAVRTVDGSLVKTVTFSPPPTATLGSLVTYTLIVPSPMISATLYNVLITDTIHPSMTVVSVITEGGTGGSLGWSGQVVTAAFTSVPSYTQAYVTITARISSALGAYAGYLITNTASMTHPTAPQITTTVPVTTLVGEPRLGLVKASAPPTSNTVGANSAVTYTVTITNWGGVSATPAYDVVFTDTLPPGMRQTTPVILNVTLNGAAVSSSDYLTGYDSTTGILTVTFVPTFAIPVSGSLVIQYVAQVNADVGAGLDLINQAQVGWSSLPGATPGDRDYGPLTGTTNIHTARPSLIKTVTPVTATLGDLITYTILLPQPPITATIYNVVVTDQLDSHVMLLTVEGGIGVVAVNGNAFTVTYTSIPAGEQRSITVTSVLSDLLGAVAGNAITNVAVLSHSAGITQSNRPVFTVTEPSLTLVKASNPPTSNTVSAGNRITYTVSITNRAGLTTSAAFDVAFTDTLPVGLRNTPPAIQSIMLDGAPVLLTDYSTNYDQATGVLTITFVPMFAIPVGGVLAIQYVAIVDSDVQAAINLINLAQVTWSSLGGAVPGDRNYGPISSTTNLHTPLVTTLGKTLTPPTVTIGSQVVFTISVPGTLIGAVLSNVVVTDVVDGRLQIVEVSPPAIFSGQLVTATFATIPTYTQQLVVVTATVRDLLTVTNGTLITNVASMNYSNNPTGTVWSPVVTTTVREPVVALSKFVQTPRAPDGAGDVVTYTLALANTGAWPAFDVIITDALPTGVEFLATQAITATDPATATTGGDYPAWSVSQLNVGGSIYITFTARVTCSIGAGLILTNSAWGWYDTQPGDNPGQRGYPVPTSTVPISTGWPLLDLTKSAAPSPAQAGDYLTYTLTVTNSGIVSATGVVITDVVPVNTSFVAATLPYIGPDASRVISWPLGTLDIGIPHVVTMVVQVISPLLNGTFITNTAWVTSTEGLTDTHTVTTPVGSNHTLMVAKSASPSPVAAGGQLLYTLAWSVGGNEPALDVTISDTIPVNTIFVTGTTPIIISGDLLTWPLGDHVPGDSGMVTFTVQVTQPLVSGTLIYNAAIITDSSGITHTGDVTTPVVSAHTLDVFKSATPGVVRPGDWLTYTIAYTITGNEPVLGVTLSDTIPAHTTFVTATLPHMLTGDLVVWPVGDYLPIASGITQATGVVTLVVQANTPLTNGLNIINTVLITDSSPLTDTHTVTTPVTSQHLITLTKTAAPDPVLAGDLLTYTLSFIITGDGIAPDVTLSDTTPPSTTFWSATPLPAAAPAPGNPGLIVWQLGSMSPPATGMVTMVVRVNSPLISGTLIYNAAIITDSSGITHTSDVTTPVVSAHTLNIVKTATPSPIVAGGTLLYTLAWSVAGSEPAFDVTISDTVPANTSFITGTTPIVVNGSLLTWPLGTHVPGDSGTVTFTVQVAQPLVSGTLILNSVVITDSGGITDTDTVTTPVVTSHAISVTKSAFPSPVQAGDWLTYTIAWGVAGNELAPDVTISDTVPQNTTYQSCYGGLSCNQSSGLVIWSLGTLTPPASGVVTLVVQVDGSLARGTLLTNTVTITDSSGLTDTDTLTTPMLTPGLVIAKSVTPGQAVPHQPFTYTIRITNTGQITFDPLVLTDTLPPSFTYVAGSGSPTDPNVIAEPLLQWNNLGPLTPGTDITVSFAVTAARGITGTFINVALVEGVTPHGTLTDTDDVPVVLRDPAVAIQKQLVAADLDTAAPNLVTFTIVITNVGPTPIAMLPLLDQYEPYYLSFAWASPMPDEPQDDGVLTWYDLTAPAPNGFGRDLSPGEAFHLATIFTVAHDITLTTFNTAVISRAVDTFDNPTNRPTDTVPITNSIPTAVELLYFRADTTGERQIRLTWATAVEIDNYGFNLYRAPVNDPALAKGIHFEPAAMLLGRSGASYAYVDTVPYDGEWWYWLADVDTQGKETRSAQASAKVGIYEAPFRVYLPLVVK
jgi:uncharacterized repeat protein (TIGR01451 family)